MRQNSFQREYELLKECNEIGGVPKTLYYFLEELRICRYFPHFEIALDLLLNGSLHLSTFFIIDNLFSNEIRKYLFII